MQKRQKYWEQQYHRDGLKGPALSLHQVSVFMKDQSFASTLAPVEEDTTDVTKFA